MKLAPLRPADLPAAKALLEAACRFDRAAAVAEEKLFGALPTATEPRPIGEWSEAGELVGVACASGATLRLLAVAPGHRGRGVGSRLLAECEARARADGAVQLSALDEPGNYLAPGVDERNLEALAWLGRRGFIAGAPRTNLIVDVRGNPKVSPARAAALADNSRAAGYQLRRAEHDDREPLAAAITEEFGGAWPFEVSRALRQPEPAVHVALKEGRFAAFAAHDGNNAGLGWFGPAGTWPAHRGKGLGEALLLACLIDVAAAHAQCEVAWIGPEAFYEKSCGVAGRRIFLPMKKALR
jgi:mycothiol synthase